MLKKKICALYYERFNYNVIQVASAYVVIASFGVHVFFNPYQKLFQNIMETLVLLNYVIFLLVRSNETILDAVNSGSYSGNLVMTSVMHLTHSSWYTNVATPIRLWSGQEMGVIWGVVLYISMDSTLRTY